MIDHVGIQCEDLAKATAFYDTVLQPLGGARLMDFGVAIGYGLPNHPNFWIGELADGVNRPIHICFQAADRATVRAFFDAAVGTGAEVLHEPSCGPSTTSTTTAPSSATPTGTTSRPAVTARSSGRGAALARLPGCRRR